MEAVHILARMRPHVLVIDTLGVIRAADGGFRSPLGHHPSALVGRRVLELIDPSEHAGVAAYFSAEDHGPDIAEVPVPYRSTLIAADGSAVIVDLICTTVLNERGTADGWVVVLVPHAALTTKTEPIEAIIRDRPLPEVLALVSSTIMTAVRDDHRAAAFVIANKQHGQLRTVYGSNDYPALRFALEEAAAGAAKNQWDDAPGDFSAVALDSLPAAVRNTAIAAGFESALIAQIEIESEYEGLVLGFAESRPGPLQENIRQLFRHAADLAAVAIERSRTRRVLEKSARFDSLTGVVNREQFWRVLTRRHGNICLLYVDIDRFKSVNDTFGHAVGDDVLRVVAHRIQSSCRPNDVVARLGGDEFAVLLESTTPDGAATVARRIVAEVGQPLGLVLGPPAVTVSVGVSVGEPDAATAIDRADSAMLAAKRAGRGRIEGDAAR